MVGKFRSLLPPGAFPEERAQEQAGAEQIETLDTNMVRKARNPDTCPAHLLPWLAWEHAVDFWDDNWTETQKRQVIKDAAYVHQHRGTAGAVRRSLASVNLPTTVVEWWEETPHAAPYTFRIEVQSSQGVSDALYHQIRQLTDRAKNLRSYLSKIDVLANVGMDGAIYIAGATTAHIDVDIFTGESHG
ncbi:phage tail protein I [Citrobacter freundii]|uniref:phage tail protein I n=1 Tax=Citrobacter TaxID=544 RepID=UPI000650ACDE|nr:MULTISPECIES: phage tail protein I [Citrobacter]KLV83391.1 phage tail protein I [Citrobacter sp. BIDMC107]MDR4050515.1 phage tail protein I [Citrobacter sp.]QKX82300.1 phage tail protein I [Citrobacter freundii]QLX94262.1 phage tail protein I [Citrobacter freundii]TKU54856.1 phage tail protein I [Citrobacter sp. wls712]